MLWTHFTAFSHVWNEKEQRRAATAAAAAANTRLDERQDRAGKIRMDALTLEHMKLT